MDALRPIDPETFEWTLPPTFNFGRDVVDAWAAKSPDRPALVWCNEAAVYETVPPSRWTRSYMLSRAMLRGRNVLRHPKERARLLAVSAVAVPAYSIVLPFTLLAGQHVFMKYGIKFCDHLGRILTFLHLNPVSQRQM